MQWDLALRPPPEALLRISPHDYDFAFQPSASSGEFWDKNKHEFAVYVTNLPMDYHARAVQRLYRERADTKNVFDELKNQWGFSGFCAKARATTELAAQPC